MIQRKTMVRGNWASSTMRVRRQIQTIRQLFVLLQLQDSHSKSVRHLWTVRRITRVITQSNRRATKGPSEMKSREPLPEIQRKEDSL